MSINLNDASLQYLERTASIPTLTFPFAFMCDVRLDDLSIDQALFGVYNSASSGNYHALLFNGSSPSNTVTARSQSATSSGDAVSSSGIGSVGWVRVIGQWISDAERYVYLDGGAIGSNTDNRTVTGLDSLAVGRLNVSTPSLYMSGQAANIAVWSGLPSGGFTVAELAQLGVLKVSPLLIRADELVLFAPLPAATPNPAIDVVGSYDLVVSGGATTGASSPPEETFDPPHANPPPIGFIQRTIVQTATAQQSIVANIHGGFPTNTALATQEMLNNVILATISSVETASQLIQENVIEDSLTNNAVAGDAITNNVIQDSLLSVPAVFDSIVSNVKQATLSNECAASQQITNNVKEDSLSNTCGAVGSIGREITLELFSNAFALQVMKTNFVCYPEIEQECEAQQTLGVNRTINISITQVCPTESKMYKTIEDTLDNTCIATNEIARGEDPSNDAEATQDITGSTCTPLANTCGATNTITATIERNLTLDNTCTATGTIHGYPCLTTCELHQYMPQGAPTLPAVSLSSRDTITLVCGSDSITLRNPEFNNTDDLNIVRALNVSRNGTYHTFRDSIWPKSQTKTFTVVNLKRTDALDILDFKTNCLGKEITYTDMEDREWVGTIINAQDGITSTGRDLYSITFEFRGVLTSEKTW
jgi:hypothetical protein